MRRASASLIGSSIDLSDDSTNSNHGEKVFKRVLSFGSSDGGSIKRTSSRLGVVLRRVSSGISSTISSRLRGSYDSLDDDDNDKNDDDKIKEPPHLRRTLSEGRYTSARSRKARLLDRDNLSFDSFDEGKAVPLSPEDMVVPDDLESQPTKSESNNGRKLSPMKTTLQTLSDNLHVTPRTRNYQRLHSNQSDDGGDVFADESLQINLELDYRNDDVHRNLPSPRPRISFPFKKKSSGK